MKIINVVIVPILFIFFTFECEVKIETDYETLAETDIDMQHICMYTPREVLDNFHLD
jgi:hypothetical protein